MMRELGITLLFAGSFALASIAGTPHYPNPLMTEVQRKAERGATTICALAAAVLAYVAGRLW